MTFKRAEGQRAAARPREELCPAAFIHRLSLKRRLFARPHPSQTARPVQPPAAAIPHKIDVI
jgi:hypothetical protein